ncbi:hypothetical protein, partial [Methylobacterium oryzisoli]|uniref:hypothetical protein n=1 Tax=Methylobacterium oryzisoli TaxID=3385502 RepID=UPI0038920281
GSPPTVRILRDPGAREGAGIVVVRTVDGDAVPNRAASDLCDCSPVAFRSYFPWRTSEQRA